MYLIVIVCIALGVFTWWRVLLGVGIVVVVVVVVVSIQGVCRGLWCMWLMFARLVVMMIVEYCES